MVPSGNMFSSSPVGYISDIINDKIIKIKISYIKIEEGEGEGGMEGGREDGEYILYKV